MQRSNPVMRSFLSLSIAAAMAAQARPAAAECKQTGPVIIEIDNMLGQGLARTLSSTVIYDTGAWRHEVYADKGGPTTTTSGCILASTLDPVKGELAKASWKVTRNPVTCDAIGLGFDVYKLHGKPVWTERLCQHEVLDKVSAQAILDLKKIVAPMTTAPAR
jgi:hypothetical protein